MDTAPLVSACGGGSATSSSSSTSSSASAGGAAAKNDSDGAAAVVRGLSAFKKEMSIEEAIEQVGVGKTQWILLIICGLTFMSDAAEVTFLSYVTEVLRCEWGMTSFQESMISSAVFVGMIMGGPVWGYTSDSMGRRPTFLVSSATICVFGFGTALAQGFYSLLIVRCIVGFGIAGLPVGFDILAEALPSSGRGAFLMYIEYFWTLGSIWVNICAWAVLDTMGWQVLTALVAIPTLLTTVAGYLYLPESPRWLVDERRDDEALVIINQWAAANGKDLQIEALEPRFVEHIGMLDLFTLPELRRPMFFMSIIWFGFGIGYYGVVMLLPRILQTGGGESGTSCTVKFNFQDIATSAVFEAIGVFVALFMVDYAGRSKTQSIFYSVGAAMCFLLGFRHMDIRVLTAVACVGRLAQMVACSATWVHTPELFPTKVRVQANSLLNLLCKFGAFVATYIISDAFTQMQCATMMAAISLAAGTAAMFVQETAGSELGAVSIMAASIRDEGSPQSRLN